MAAKNPSTKYAHRHVRAYRRHCSVITLETESVLIKRNANNRLSLSRFSEGAEWSDVGLDLLPYQRKELNSLASDLPFEREVLDEARYIISTRLLKVIRNSQAEAARRANRTLDELESSSGRLVVASDGFRYDITDVRSQIANLRLLQSKQGNTSGHTNRHRVNFGVTILKLHDMVEGNTHNGLFPKVHFEVHFRTPGRLTEWISYHHRSSYEAPKKSMVRARDYS